MYNIIIKYLFYILSGANPEWNKKKKYNPKREVNKKTDKKWRGMDRRGVVHNRTLTKTGRRLKPHTFIS